MHSRLSVTLALVWMLSLSPFSVTATGPFLNAKPLYFQDAQPAIEAPQDVEDEETPSYDEIQQELNNLLRKGPDGLDAAIVYLEEHAKRFPISHEINLVSISLNMSQGLKLMSEDKSAEAVKAFSNCEKIANAVLADPDHLVEAESFLAQVYFHVGQGYAIEGKNKEMYTALEKAFELGFEEVANFKDTEGYAKIAEDQEFKDFIAKQSALIIERVKVKLDKEFSNFEGFDFDFKLTTIDGTEVEKANYRGKVLIVDIWGTWCPPCRAELPHFVDMQKKYGEKGLQIFGCNSENEETEAEQIETVKKTIDEFKINYPCALIDEKFLEKVPDFEGFPTTLFIDVTGKVRLVMVGSQSEAKLEMAINHLLNEVKPKD